MLKIIPILACVLAAFNAYSQKIWTLEECIVYAHENNLQVRQTKINSEISNLALIQSKAGALPNLNAGANHNYNFGRTVDPFTNQFTTNTVRSNSFSLNSSVNLFNGFQTVNTIRQNKFEYLASTYDTEQIKNNISLNITSAYLQILLTRELIQTAAYQLEVTNRQIERTKRLVTAGSLPESILLDLVAQRASEEAEWVNAQNQYDLSLISLSQMLDLPSAEEFQIAQPAIDIAVADTQSADPSQVYEMAVSNLPEIKSSEYRLKSAETGVRISRGRISPSLTLRGSVSTLYSSSSEQIIGFTTTGVTLIGATTGGDSVYAPSYSRLTEKKSFNDQFNDNLSKFIGFNLSIPIFNGWQTRTAIARSRLLVKNAEYELQLNKNQVRKNIQMAYADAVASLKQYQSTLKSAEALEASMLSSEKRYVAGLLNSFDYYQAKNRLAIAQSNLLRSKYDYVFKTKILEFYQGKPLRLE
jgi:outer membrane protein